LSLVAEPRYARITLEPTGLDIFSAYTRSQNSSSEIMGADHTEEHLERGIPDAYWWQLIRTSLLKGLELTSAGQQTLTRELTIVTFGEPEDWIPQIKPGERKILASPPDKTLEVARSDLRPLLSYY
jgi:hypothetical protein